MSGAVDHGITVTEIAAMDRPVGVFTETTAAFVGRALRGPVNTPVLVSNFGEFRRRFGDIWPRSSLGPAVKQFFLHGGLRLYVVRVVNNARGAMLCLPASGTAVVLRAIEPGSTEHVRAAVDYDDVADSDDLFNLTLQRVDPGSGLVLDQELFRRLSYREDADSFIGDALLTSTLARLEHPYPTHRPEPTYGQGRRFDSSYIDHAQAGTDGSQLTDYDLIGSQKARTGMFALEDIESFDLLYLTPPGSRADVGPTAILAGELYCRRRGAMLIVDPRVEWSTPDAATDGIRDLGYASPNMLAYFPWIVARSEDKASVRQPGGAIAGLLCKHDRTYGAWQDLNQPGMGLQRRFSPALAIDEDKRRMLNRAGLNVLAEGPAGRSRLLGSVTMGRGSEVHRQYASLPVRRFCLQIANAIAKAGRWAVFEPDHETITDRIRAQVLDYFRALDELGAFVDRRFLVRCEVDNERPQCVTILLVFHPTGSDEAVSLTVQLTAAGCRVASAAFAPSIENAPEASPVHIT